jgi:hypothetical protein
MAREGKDGGRGRQGKAKRNGGKGRFEKKREWEEGVREGEGETVTEGKVGKHSRAVGSTEREGRKGREGSGRYGNRDQGGKRR